MLRAEHITKSFGGISLIEEASLYIRAGDIVGIMGDNGTGKTTFFNILTGMVKPESGQLWFDEENITSTTPLVRAQKGMVRLFQKPRVFAKQTLVENLLAAVHQHPGEIWWKYFVQYPQIKKFEAHACQEAYDVLEIIGLMGKSSHLGEELSYGQQKLLSFGMLLMNKPRLILLDEFFAGVSEEMVLKMMDVLKSLQAKGIAILMIEHHQEALFQICDRVCVLQNGTFQAKKVN